VLAAAIVEKAVFGFVMSVVAPSRSRPVSDRQAGASAKSPVVSTPTPRVGLSTAFVCLETMGGLMSDLESQAEKDLEQDPQLKQDAEKKAEQQGQDVEQDLKKDL
jgi:hypothetical protein